MVTSFLLSMLEHLGQNIFKQKSFWIGCLIDYSLIFVDALILRLFLIFTIHLKEEKNGFKRKTFCFVIKVFSFFLFIPRFDQILFPKGMKYAKWTFTSFSAKVNVSYSSFKTFARTFWKFCKELHQIKGVFFRKVPPRKVLSMELVPLNRIKSPSTLVPPKATRGAKNNQNRRFLTFLTSGSFGWDQCT